VMQLGRMRRVQSMIERGGFDPIREESRGFGL